MTMKHRVMQQADKIAKDVLKQIAQNCEKYQAQQKAKARPRRPRPGGGASGRR